MRTGRWKRGIHQPRWSGMALSGTRSSTEKQLACPLPGLTLTGPPAKGKKLSCTVKSEARDNLRHSQPHILLIPTKVGRNLIRGGRATKTRPEEPEGMLVAILSSHLPLHPDHTGDLSAVL